MDYVLPCRFGLTRHQVTEKLSGSSHLCHVSSSRGGCQSWKKCGNAPGSCCSCKTSTLPGRSRRSEDSVRFFCAFLAPRHSENQRPGEIDHVDEGRRLDNVCFNLLVYILLFKTIVCYDNRDRLMLLTDTLWGVLLS